MGNLTQNEALSVGHLTFQSNADQHHNRKDLAGGYFTISTANLYTGKFDQKFSTNAQEFAGRGEGGGGVKGGMGSLILKFSGKCFSIFNGFRNYK